MIVHVVSWSPSAVADGGSGGFEWRYGREDAVRVMNRLLAMYQDTDHTNLTLCVVDVPANTDASDQPRYITEWIDRNLHLVEPSLPNS